MIITVTLRFERPSLLGKVKTGSAYASCVSRLCGRDGASS